MKIQNDEAYTALKLIEAMCVNWEHSEQDIVDRAFGLARRAHAWIERAGMYEFTDLAMQETAKTADDD